MKSTEEFGGASLWGLVCKLRIRVSIRVVCVSAHVGSADDGHNEVVRLARVRLHNGHGHGHAWKRPRAAIDGRVSRRGRRDIRRGGLKRGEPAQAH